MARNFAHLHVHTEYSLLDGTIRLDSLFSRCEEIGISAVAITDHGNMYGALEFIKQAIKHTDPQADPYEFLASGRELKVKPIIGCEVYMTDDMSVKSAVNGKKPKLNHLILLAKNEIGYKNLIKIVSLGFLDGFYYKPRVDFELLKKYSEGLVCLSACLAGVIPQCLLLGDVKGADEWAQKFKGVFGDDFYIELQDHNIREQKMILPSLRDVAIKNGIKMVCTNDAHYLKKSDALMQKVLQCISFRKTMSPDETYNDGLGDSLGGDDSYFPTREFYLKDGDEMEKLFGGYENALDSSLEIAEKCDYHFFRKEKLLPGYYPEDGSKPSEFLRKMCYEGLVEKYHTITDEIRERAEYELGVIERLGFVDYFLIVWDFIHFAETHDVPVGPGRGSGVGSIVAYAIGITKVDPLRYALIFERFLNAERVSNPDFDIDFCVDGRERVIEYVISKYGVENVSQIVTFGTLAAKAAIKDVGRVFNHPYSEVDKITKLMPKMMGKNHIGHLIGLIPGKKDAPNPVIPELVELYQNDQMSKKIIDMAMQIEGMPRQTGMHAAGVIICKDIISDHVPMSMSSEGIVTTEFNMVECEELGLLKMDFLGLRTLTDISKAVKYVKQTKGIDIQFYNMEYDDQEVFKLISEGDTHAVFQLEGEGMKKFMRELRPTCLEDVIAGISLYRPGPMDKISDYIRGKHNPESIKYDHPLLEPILKVTYGIMVYQEQVMEIVRKLGGYSFGRADIVRRMMSKKKADAMAKERQIFLHGTVDHGVEIKGCIANGVSEEIANKIFDDMTSFASYAFNKSHAAAYAYLSYQTAYLKRYHTVEFITAVLNNRITSIEEITNYLTYLKQKKIDVFPPDVNKSFADFAVENGGVRIGLAAIKNVGAAVVQDIVEEREANGIFTDFVQFVTRMQERAKTNKEAGRASINRKMLESLIFAGAFDCLGNARSQLIAVYPRVLDRADKDIAARASGQFSFFDMVEETNTFEYPDIEEYPVEQKLKYEKDVAGVYLSGHPLMQYADYLATFPHNTSMLRLRDDDGALESGLTENSSVTLGGMIMEADKITTQSGAEIGKGRIEDLYGSVNIMLGSRRFNSLKAKWQKDKLCKISGKLSIKDDQITIWVDSIEPWEQISSPSTQMMCLYMSFSSIGENVLSDALEIIRAYPGDDEIFIKNTDDNTMSRIETRAEACENLRAELFGVIGIDDIKIASRRKKA